MTHFKLIILFFLITAIHFSSYACTIVAVSGRVTEDGRPLLLKNRDSSAGNIKIKIGGGGSKYVYLCQCTISDGVALSGYNETGFSIVNSHSYNMPNTESGWNAQIMQLALENCSSVNGFDSLLNSLTKPIAVCANYGVMDAQGNVAIFEVNAYTHTRYDVDSSSEGYLIRTNYSLSGDTTIINTVTTTSTSRYQIASRYLADAVTTSGFLCKEHILGLSRCLVDSIGVDLREMAPLNQNVSTPVVFTHYVPNRSSTSAMVIQGVLPNENPSLTVSWTMVGPPLSTVTIPLWINSDRVLLKKATLGEDGFAWLPHCGQQLKNSIFINNMTIDLAMLYNLSSTGIMQKICMIEEDILILGEELLEGMRRNGFSTNDVATYYAWVDNYLENQYSQYFYNGAPANAINDVSDDTVVRETEYYDLLGRRVRNAPDNAVIKRTGNKAIILN